MGELKRKKGSLPKQFDFVNLTNLFVDHFVTWDQGHRKLIPVYDDCYVRTPYKDYIMKLPRDYNGKLDVSNGTYSREKKTFDKV